MRTLVINIGSSSVKGVLFDEDKPIWRKKIPWKADCLIEFFDEFAKEKLHPDVIGHRVVHGGPHHRNPCFIDEAVKRAISDYAPLAYLHNERTLEAIEIASALGLPQMAVFDTGFHQTLPKKAQAYALPSSFYQKGLYRYGFHGISFAYCSKRVTEFYQRSPPSKTVICHIGSGSSLCALQDGISIDTTMGYTPLEGLMMSTRSGSVDPGILFHLQRQGMSFQAVEELLYEKSGLLGVSGKSGDIREIFRGIEEDDSQCLFTYQLFLHKMKQQLGMMIASLEGIEALVFAGGVGERCWQLRRDLCDALNYLSVKIDLEKNLRNDQMDHEISLPNSEVKVLVIKTNEELEIARCSKELMANQLS